MAYAVIRNSDNYSVTVDIYNLQYPALRYDSFMLFLNSVQMGDVKNTSLDSYSVSFTFDISRAANGHAPVDGSYYVHIKAVFDGSAYEIGINGNNVISINRGGSGSQSNPITQIKILAIDSAEDGHARLLVKVNGYGDIYLISMTKAWNLFNGTMGDYSKQLDRRTISPNQLQGGYFEGYLDFYFDATDLSFFPSTPAGTCYLAAGYGYGGRHFREYDYLSKAFFCMSPYRNWSIYNGSYSTTLSTYNNAFVTNARELSSVYNDWIRLINMSFYLESTTYGTIKYTQYSSYIPQQGHIITAGMYNALLESVARCVERIGITANRLPTHVFSGEIISRNFIYDIGVVVDDCLQKQRDETNFYAIDRY